MDIRVYDFLQRLNKLCKEHKRVTKIWDQTQKGDAKFGLDEVDFMMDKVRDDIVAEVLEHFKDETCLI